MKKIILTIIIVFNFGVISDTFAATFTQDCQMQKIRAQQTAIQPSERCREAERFSENVDKVVGPIGFSLKYLFGTLFIVIAASGAAALFLASLSSIFKQKNAYGVPKSPVFGWLGLFLIVPLLIYIFYEFNYYAPYGYYRWVFTITLIGLIFYGVIELFRKKTPKSK